MTWTALTFSFGSTLTSTKMTQLQDNITALANGDSGAPPIVSAALAYPPGWEFLTSLEESALTEADFPTVFSDNSGYDAFKIVGVCRPATNATVLRLRITDDNGSTYESGASDYDYATTATNGASGDHLPLQSSVSNSANDWALVDVEIEYPNNASYKTWFSYKIGSRNSSTSTTLQVVTGVGTYDVASALTGVELYFSSGNISHSLSVFGLKK